MTRMRLCRGLVAAAVGISLAGCIKVDMSLRINEDDSLDGAVILAFSEQLIEFSGQVPTDLMEQFRSEVMADVREGVTEEPYQAEGFRGTRLVLDDVPLQELSQDEESLSIVHEGDEYVVHGTLDLTAGGELGEMGLAERALVDRFADRMDLRVAIAFPGEVVEHNGQLNERTVTWAPAFGEALDIYARAEDSPSTALVWWIAAGVAASMLAGLLVVLVLRRQPATTPTELPFPAPPEQPVGGPAPAQYQRPTSDERPPA